MQPLQNLNCKALIILSTKSRVIINTPANFCNITEYISWHAKTKPELPAFTYLENGETEKEQFTFSQLHHRACDLAQRLSHLSQQATVLVLLPSDIRFIIAFIACQYAGMVAVPAYPPSGKHKRERLNSILNDAKSSTIITTEDIKEQCLKWSKDTLLFNDVKWISYKSSVENVDRLSSYSTKFPKKIDPNWLSFIQYTSGSTGKPKGVIVSHENLISNQRMIENVFQHNSSTVFAGWLPLHHDMGLVGNVLQPLYLGISCYLMPPIAFIQKPIRWLNVISKYGATTSGGPNFSYDLCTKRTTRQQRENLDLSQWKVAFNGSEPVKATTLDTFYEEFSQFGFKRESLFPVYGMAEATLLVSGGDINEVARIDTLDAEALSQGVAKRLVDNKGLATKTKRLVGCGKSSPGQEIIIVDPESKKLLTENEIGEVWLSGPNISLGYQNRPEINLEIFNATVINEDITSKQHGNEGSNTDYLAYLRTGDLGYLSAGELFITGRIKDLMIIRGVNHYPQDIEYTIESFSTMFVPNATAVFSVAIDDNECVIAVQEIERRALKKFSSKDLIHQLRQLISLEHGITLKNICFVRPMSLHKTTSGKIQRSKCREQFLNSELNYVNELKEMQLIQEDNKQINTEVA